MGSPKASRGKLPLSIIAITICMLAFLALLYTEIISFSSSTSIFRSKSCTRKYAAKKIVTDKRKVDEALRHATDDRFEFDPKECSLNQGKWVFNHTNKPLYTDTSCPYLDRQVSCVKNGKQDLDYHKWEWEPDDCLLPRFNPRTALLKLQGKRIMFVGDSLQRGQWQSLVCLVESFYGAFGRTPGAQTGGTRRGSNASTKRSRSGINGTGEPVPTRGSCAQWWMSSER